MANRFSRKRTAAGSGKLRSRSIIARRARAEADGGAGARLDVSTTRQLDRLQLCAPGSRTIQDSPQSPQKNDCSPKWSFTRTVCTESHDGHRGTFLSAGRPSCACAGLCLLSIAPRDREPTRRVHRCCDDAETATIKMLSAARATFCRLSDIRRVFRATERTLSSSLRRVAIALTASTVIVASDTVRRSTCRLPSGLSGEYGSRYEAPQPQIMAVASPRNQRLQQNPRVSRGFFHFAGTSGPRWFARPRETGARRLQAAGLVRTSCRRPYPGSAGSFPADRDRRSRPCTPRPSSRPRRPCSRR